MKRKGRLPVAACVIALALCGCPQRLAPAAAPTLSSPDLQANQAFTAARRLFDGGELQAADAALVAFVARYHDDPLVPLAGVYRGRIALQQQRLAAARDLLSEPARRPVDDAIGVHARYYLGLVLVRLGDYARGKQLLDGFNGPLAEEERLAVLAALARATRQLGQAKAAAGHLAELYELTDRPVEQLHARLELEAVLQSPALTSEELQALYAQAAPTSLLAALAAQQLAIRERAAGRTAAAEQLLSVTAQARAKHRLVAAPTREGAPRQPSEQPVGLLIPSEGRLRDAGRELLLGAVAASGLFQAGDRTPLPFALRDSGRGAANAARELIEEQNAITLIGTFEAAEAQTVAETAARYELPFLSLARMPPAPAGSRTMFSLLPDNRARASALARYAHRLKLRRAVIVAPQTAFGASMADSFAAAFAEGGTVVRRLVYAPQTTSFAPLAAQLADRQLRFDVLFVPDSARVLALLAPALAGAGCWAVPTGASAPPKGRGVQLLATADALTDRLVATAGRYVQGAVLAPGFYPDAPAGLLARFTAQHGRPPTLVEALAFDAVELIRTLQREGAQDRSGLLTALRAGRAVEGLTGKMRFSSDGQRIDPPLLYQVRGERIVRMP